MFKLNSLKLTAKVNTLDVLIMQLGQAYDALLDYKRNLEGKEEALAARITDIQDEISAVDAVLKDVHLPE